MPPSQPNSDILLSLYLIYLQFSQINCIILTKPSFTNKNDIWQTSMLKKWQINLKIIGLIIQLQDFKVHVQSCTCTTNVLFCRKRNTFFFWKNTSSIMKWMVPNTGSCHIAIGLSQSNAVVYRQCNIMKPAIGGTILLLLINT